MPRSHVVNNRRHCTPFVDVLNGRMTGNTAHLNSLLAAASDARRQGDFVRERVALDRALTLSADDPQILNLYGMNALSSGNFAEARDAFRSAASLDPGQPALWMNVATACRALGDEDGEEACLRTVLTLDARHFMGQLRSAEQQQRLGNSQAAAQHWNNVVQMALAIDDRPLAVSDALKRGQSFLSEHNAELASAVNAALGDRIAEMGKSARRFQACMDHSFGRRAVYANKCAGIHFPFLPADEFFDREHFPWMEKLEAQTEVIAQEALALLSGNSKLIRPYVKMPEGSPASIWSTLDGSLDWGACFLWEYGVRNDPVCELCPGTAAALAEIPQTDIPDKAPTAFFSILQAGGHIPPHTGVTNSRTIIHLPLVVPDNCEFRVGGETRAWEKGRAFAFDDTIEHEAWNRSDRPRLVLIFDVWNPYLSEDEQHLLREFYTITGAKV